VALAGDAADVRALGDAQGWPGFDVAAVLAEMGFQVRCLVHAKGDAPRPRGLAAGAEWKTFHTRAELDALLADGVDLAFSHFNHDPRLQRHAVRPFCESAFKPGPAGLRRSMKRLLHLADTRPLPGHRHLLGSRP
jgi:hypothetical protein